MESIQTQMEMCTAAPGRGIDVWDPMGAPLGFIGVGNGGVSNFVFVPGGMYIFKEARLFHLTIQARGREVRRDFGLVQ